MSNNVLAVHALQIALQLVSASGLITDPQGYLKSLLVRKRSYAGDLLHMLNAFNNSADFYKWLWDELSPSIRRRGIPPLTLSRTIMGVPYGDADAIWLAWLKRFPNCLEEAVAVALWEATYARLVRFSTQNSVSPELYLKRELPLSSSDLSDLVAHLVAIEAWYLERRAAVIGVAPLKDSGGAGEVNATAVAARERDWYAAVLDKLQADLLHFDCSVSADEAIARWFGSGSAFWQRLQDDAWWENTVFTFAAKIAEWEKALARVCTASNLTPDIVLRIAPVLPSEFECSSGYGIDAWTTRSAILLGPYHIPSAINPLTKPIPPVDTVNADWGPVVRGDACAAVLDGSEAMQHLATAFGCYLGTFGGDLRIYEDKGIVVARPPKSFREAYVLAHRLSACIPVLNRKPLFIDVSLRKALAGACAAINSREARWIVTDDLAVDALKLRLFSFMKSCGLTPEQMRYTFREATGYTKFADALERGVHPEAVLEAVHYYFNAQQPSTLIVF
ncbi:MAG: hypothetical protein KatS3mg038_1031 [Candidatus Kapaibacterium sp.]|nr:MAG: hypothetical protein KatS3mg038_1031 [Candidatus Kapabacteria bacterium]